MTTKLRLVTDEKREALILLRARAALKVVKAKLDFGEGSKEHKDAVREYEPLRDKTDMEVKRR